LYPVHVFGHVTVCPQLLVTGPHALPAHAAASSGLQPQVLAVAPTPPQIVPPAQVSGHVTVCPQLLTAVPHARVAQVVASDSETHAHADGEPVHTSPSAHGVQRPGVSQPLFASVGTHFPSHSLVPAPHEPTVHALPLHTSVPLG